MGLLTPGRNCWRIEHASRVSFLIDGAAYFRAVRAALASAQRSIFILSWDIDSRMHLVPEGANDGFPESLGDFLHALVSSRKDLHAYILNWDFAMLYALEREWLPVYKLDWRTHRRLSFRMDGHHPIGASHHQKVVVIDDKIAFLGGFDLTRCRWDTPAHSATEPLRCDADDKPYSPFHDVQAIVDGNVARALGELARERWMRATGSRIDATFTDSSHDPWPKNVTPDITDLDIAIARTEPKFENQPAVGEIQQLHFDAINHAKRHIYFENQYFTSGIIADALLPRLNEVDGPEFIVACPRTESGWLEEVTMGVLRARLHRRLKEMDVHGHYRMYCPILSSGVEQNTLNVHSKVTIVDDELLSLGSANLSNRSMVLDTECNMIIEARNDTRISCAIAHLRNRLLAEHLATTPEIVAQKMKHEPSLIAAIESLKKPGRSLDTLDPIVTPELDALVPVTAFVDPEQPIDPEELLAQLVPREASRPVTGQVSGFAILAFVLAILAITWQWTPLHEWLNIKSLVGFARELENAPLAPIAIVCAYLIASLLMVPVTVLIAVTGIVFGPLVGGLYAMSGTLLSAALGYGLGRWLGHDAVRRLAGTRINRISKRIAKGGFLAVAVIRLLPVAPFTIINLVAGASHIKLRDFLIGTFIGLSPGIVITVTFFHNLVETMRNPTLIAFGVLATLVGVLVAIAIVAWRYFGGKEEQATNTQ
ncbi:MAG: VTT domain-containing protein [Pseudomonadota bacterium]